MDYPYIEWYSHENGRVVIELAADQIEVVGTPIPACESDPVSRVEQHANLAAYLNDLSQKIGVPAMAITGESCVVSDPAFSHWVVERDQIIGEAKDVESAQNGISLAFVRLFAMPECAEFGSIEVRNLLRKDGEHQP